MKNLIFGLIIAIFVFTGCSKKEETVAQQPEAAPDTVEEAVEETETAASEAESTGSSLVETVEKMKESLPSPEELEEDSTSGTSMPSLASGLSWDNFSWDQVPEVPYANKEELAVWAGSKVEVWKDKLTEAAKTQGLSMLSNLGDGGWQGALKDVVDAIDGVREANPETWEMARGALLSSWEQFEAKATEFLGNN